MNDKDSKLCESLTKDTTFTHYLIHNYQNNCEAQVKEQSNNAKEVKNKKHMQKNTNLIDKNQFKVLSHNNKQSDKKELILNHISSTTRLRSAYPSLYKRTHSSSEHDEKKNSITKKVELNKNTETKLKYVQNNPVKKENNFLFNEYNEKFRINCEIRNEKVNKLFKETKVGPYFTHCPSCNRKNLEFYDKLRPETAINLLKLTKNKFN